MSKKYFRSTQARMAYTQTLKSAFQRLFVKARKLGWSQTFLLEQRSKLFDGDGINTRTGDWQKLTSVDQASLFGYWEALADALLNSLEFRYLINDKWYTPDEVITHKDGTDCSRDIPSPCTNGHFVYAINLESGTVYHIYS